MPVSLRPYQNTAVERCFAFWQKVVRNLLLIAAVGAGKTIIASEIMRRHLQDAAKRILFLAHREELLEQTVEKLATVDENIVTGIEQGSSVCPRTAQVMVASIATVKNLNRIRRWTPLEKISLIIVDECHHCTSSTYVDVLHEITKANPQRYLLGITATPIRLDGENLSLVFDQLSYRIDLTELIDAGYLCPIRGYTIKTNTTLTGLHVTAEGDYDPDELASLIDNSGRNQIIVKSYLKHGENRPGVAFVANVNHAVHLAMEFRKNGIQAQAVHGKMKKEERRDIIRDYQAGNIQMLTNCNVLCLDSQTEILTEEGWVGMHDMSYSHRVANWDNGHIFFAPPQFIVRRKRLPQERMVILETKNLSLRITEDHRMVYRNGGRNWHIEHAREVVGKPGQFPVSGFAEPTAIPRPHDHPGYTPPEQLTLAECELIGCWLGSGQKDDLPSGGVAYKFIQPINRPNGAHHIDELLAQCHLDALKVKRDPGGSKTNRNAFWVWSLPRETGYGSPTHLKPYLLKEGTRLYFCFNETQFTALLHGLWRAAGENHHDRIIPPRHVRISGASQNLLDLLQAVAVCRGYDARILVEKKPCKKHTQPLLILSLTHRQHHDLTQQRLAFEPGWVDEIVWCVTSDTGNIITRRRGTVCVTGNTEGFDAPHTGCVIIGRPTKSPVVYPQSIGRGLRLHKSKKDCLVLDIVDMASQGVITLPKLFNLPENMRLAGENIRQVQKTVEMAKTYHPNLDWEVKRQFTTDDIRKLLQPPDFYHLAETIVPDDSTSIAWTPLNQQFVAIIDAQNKREARIYRDDLGVWRLRYDRKEYSLGAKKQDALAGATQYLKKLLQPEDLARVLHPLPNEQPATAAQIQALEAFQIPTSTFDKLTQSKAAALIQKLEFIKYIFRTKGQFQSGRYLGQYYEMVYFFDPDYIVDGVAKVNKYIADRTQPLNTLQWLRKNKPELFGTNLLPDYEKVLELCLHQPNKYHAMVRAALDGSPEFMQMRSQHSQHRQQRVAEYAKNKTPTSTPVLCTPNAPATSLG